MEYSSLAVPPGGDAVMPINQAFEVHARHRPMEEDGWGLGEDYVQERTGKMRKQLRKAERHNGQHETTLLHDAMLGRRPNLDGLTVKQLISVTARQRRI
jgi:hypothetical protein